MRTGNKRHQAVNSDEYIPRAIEMGRGNHIRSIV